MTKELRCEDMDGETSRTAHLPNATPRQMAALIELYHRDGGCLPAFPATPKRRRGAPKGKFTVFEFVGSARESVDGYIMVPWRGMLVGIEKDGYTHT